MGSRSGEHGLLAAGPGRQPGGLRRARRLSQQVGGVAPRGGVLAHSQRVLEHNLGRHGSLLHSLHLLVHPGLASRYEPRLMGNVVGFGVCHVSNMPPPQSLVRDCACSSDLFTVHGEDEKEVEIASQGEALNLWVNTKTCAVQRKVIWFQDARYRMLATASPHTIPSTGVYDRSELSCDKARLLAGSSSMRSGESLKPWTAV
mmetsp:Transcript_36731/g.70410  ORF Transcript_36731/g.70410 Transcript_36731/m.70410 type:complete len:202 (+) Transcript_36731:2069-2674(+)